MNMKATRTLGKFVTSVKLDTFTKILYFRLSLSSISPSAQMAKTKFLTQLIFIVTLIYFIHLALATEDQCEECECECPKPKTRTKYVVVEVPKVIIFT